MKSLPVCVLPGDTSSLGLTLPYPGLGLAASVSISHLNALFFKVSLFLTKQPQCQTTQDRARNFNNIWILSLSVLQVNGKWISNNVENYWKFECQTLVVIFFTFS